MNIPSPVSLGLPEKYQVWRPAQLDSLHWLLAKQKRVKGVGAPTGFGKTAVNVGYAVLSKRKTIFVTDSIALQDDIMEHGKKLGMVDIRGRGRYQCQMGNDLTCEEGGASRCPYKGRVYCPADNALIRISEANYGVTNYDKWIAAGRTQHLKHFEQAVFDEADLVPEKLAKALQVILSPNEVNNDLGLDFPRQAEEITNWNVWALKASLVAERKLFEWKEKVRSTSQPRQAWIKMYLHYRNLTRRLVRVASAHSDNWVVDELEKDGGYQFDPIRPGVYGESALLMKMPNVLMVSATLREKTLHMTGIGREQYDYKEYPSEFDPRRSPVYYVPTLRVDSHAYDLSALWIKLDQWAAARRDRKGLVETVSFLKQTAALEASRHRGSMLLNRKGEPASKVLDAYRRSGPGAILVSPSFGTGHSFEMKECEWIFVCKVPFPHQTKIVKARTVADPEYPHALAMHKFEQIVGRGTRSKLDQCESVIVDLHLKWFWPKYKHLATPTLRSRWKELEYLPAPPPRL